MEYAVASFFLIVGMTFNGVAFISFKDIVYTDNAASFSFSLPKPRTFTVLNFKILLDFILSNKLSSAEDKRVSRLS
jgi:hypothetical protein